MGFTIAAKNIMLDALTPDRIRLHSDDPGSDGTENQISGALAEVTFGAAADGERLLSADVELTGLTPLEDVAYLSVWDNNGDNPILLGLSEVTGDQTVNASGEYTVSAEVTKLALVNLV